MPSELEFNEADPNARFGLVTYHFGQHNRPKPRENHDNASLDDLVIDKVAEAVRFFGLPFYDSFTLSVTEYTPSVTPLDPSTTLRSLCSGHILPVRKNRHDKFECEVFLHCIRTSVASLRPGSMSAADLGVRAVVVRGPWTRNSKDHDRNTRPQETSITKIAVKMFGGGQTVWIHNLTKSTRADICLSRLLSYIGQPQLPWHSVGTLPLHRHLQPGLGPLTIGQLLRSEQFPATWHQRDGEPWGSITLDLFAHLTSVSGIVPAAAP